MTRDLYDQFTDPLPDLPPVDPSQMPHGPLCACCYAEDVPGNPVESACTHDPVRSAATGMYHCPDCSAMVLAGAPHGPICRECAVRVHGGGA